jgi:lipoprotein-anchoring transpeptidase ErfK/SrfK
MPWMQRIDQYGIALHGGFNPCYPASHGCIRLPVAFAKKLYSVTDIGTPVYIGA